LIAKDTQQAMEHQDWTPVKIVRRGAPKPAGTVAAQADRAGRVKAAVKSGVAVSAAAAAIERKAEEGALKLKRVATESRQAIVQARLALKMTQDQADAHCALPKHTIKGLEAGTAHPSPEVIRKISRGLRVDIKLE
jgi:hypothetical protein